MSDLSWSQAMFWYCVGSLATMLLANLWKLAKLRRRKNKRIGLPAPACQRFPDWDTATSMFTKRQAD